MLYNVNQVVLFFVAAIQIKYFVLTGIHESSPTNINCTTFLASVTWKPEAESFLLAEGESLYLDCGVCKNCSEFAKECAKDFDMEAWTIQRTRFLGYGGSIDGQIEDPPFDLYNIRARLHERLWPAADRYPDNLEYFLRGDYSSLSPTPGDELEFENETIVGEAQPPEEDEPEAEKEERRGENVKLYLTVSRSNEDIEVLRPPKKQRKLARVYMTIDTIFFRQTRLEDTGVYTCFWNGLKLREWTVTVIRPQQEPYRHVTSNISIQLGVLGSMVDGSLEELIPQPAFLSHQVLVSNNLILFTSWSPWTQCIPCLPQSTNTLKPNESYGYQMRVGTCRVRLLDQSQAIRPHFLSLMIGGVLRLYDENGLPCRSHVLREVVQHYGPSEVKFRPSEIEHRKCVYRCNVLTESGRIQVFRHPTRIQLRVNEGEQLFISCPVRGQIRGPITWYYSLSDEEALINLTKHSMLEENLDQFGSPSAFAIAHLTPIPLSTLYQQTRGRFRLDPGHNLLMAEALSQPPPGEEKLHHLACFHGDPRTRREHGFSDWAGIIDISVNKRTYTVIILSKMSQIILLLMPFILALGTFFVIVIAIQTERKPNMRAASEGLTNKSYI